MQQPDIESHAFNSYAFRTLCYFYERVSRNTTACARSITITHILCHVSLTTENQKSCLIKISEFLVSLIGASVLRCMPKACRQPPIPLQMFHSLQMTPLIHATHLPLTAQPKHQSQQRIPRVVSLATSTKSAARLPNWDIPFLVACLSIGQCSRPGLPDLPQAMFAPTA